MFCSTRVAQLLVVVALLLAAPPPVAAQRAPATLPNVLLVIIDDLGWADIAPNNPGTFYETPAFASFAETAVNFTRGYAASPVCSPTRVSIMSGVSPARDRATEWFWDQPARSARFLSADRINFLPNDRLTIAEVLRPLGYQTLFVGKWHLGGVARHLPQNRGFDKNIAGSFRGGPGDNGYFAPYNIGLDGPEGEHLPARLTDETITWLRERDQERPFFATLSYYSVHTPLEGRPDLIEKYEARARELGWSEDDRFATEEQVWPVDRERLVRVKQDHAVYGAMVEAMDEQFGRLLGALEELGVADDTIVFVVSDNGGLSTAEGSPTANLPLRGGKGWLYEGGIRVPFLFRWPGVTPAGANITDSVHTSDILPTILDAIGADPVELDPRLTALEGRSMRAAVAGRDAGRPLYFHYPHYSNQGGFPGGVMIAGPWKYILRYEDGRGQLFNLDADIGERSDLAGDQPRLASRMRAALKGWLLEQDAAVLTERGDSGRPWRLRSDD